MKPEQKIELSQEWLDNAYKLIPSELEYLLSDNYLLSASEHWQLEKLTDAVIQGAQHYQSKVVEYLNNRHKQHLELATNTNSELLREACIQDCKTVKAILDDLTNLKP